MSIETQAARVLGTHVKFFRDGDEFTTPVEATCGRNSIPGDDDEGWIDLGPIVEAGVEMEREEKEVWGPSEGQILLHEVIETKRNFIRSFMAQEMSPFVIEHIYGASALDEVSEDFFALQGSTKKGWLLITRYDQDSNLIVREKAYVHLSIVGEVRLDSDIASAPFEAQQLITLAEEDLSSEGDGIEVVDTLEEMLALESTEDLIAVFIHEPESGIGKFYYFVFGDTTTADGFNVIEPDDGGGRFFVVL